jgi:hypothetical protein
MEGLECELDALRLGSKLKMYLRGAVEVKTRAQVGGPLDRSITGVRPGLGTLGAGSQGPLGEVAENRIVWNRFEESFRV